MDLADDLVRLRRWQSDDADAVLTACQDTEIQRWIPVIPRPYTLEDARSFVADPNGPRFAIVVDGEVVGSIDMTVTHGCTGQVGYWCAATSRGRGVMTRSLRLVRPPRV